MVSNSHNINDILLEILDLFKKITTEPRGSIKIEKQIDYLQDLIYKHLDHQDYTDSE